MVALERCDPEREGETKEEIEVGEEEWPTLSSVQQWLEGRVEALTSWPHTEIAEQLQ